MQPSNKSKFANFFQQSRGAKLTALVAVLAIIIGGVFVVHSFGSGFFASSEAEQSTLAGSAAVVSDTTASGGKAIQFSTPTSTTPPTPPVVTPPPSSGAWPTDFNTGVPHGLAGDTRAAVVTKANYPGGLPAYTGPMTITTAGTVIDGKHINGVLTVNAHNVVIKNSYLTVNQGTDTSGHAIMSIDDNNNLLVEDSEIDGQNSDSEGGGTFGVGRTGYTLLRVNLHNTGDLTRIDGHATIQDSYLHDPNGSNGAQHNDVIQSTNATYVRILHNTLVNYKNQTSCILLKADLGDISNVVVDNNLMAGGGYSFYWYDGKDPNGAVHYIHGGSVTNNHFVRTPEAGAVWPKGGYWGPVAVNAVTNPTTWSGNVWDDNGALIGL